MRQAFSHICADRAELSLAGGGVNILGTKHTWQPATDDFLSGSDGEKFTARTAQLEKLKNGKFLYDNQALKIDADVDPRLKRPVAGNSPDKVVEASAGVEETRPYGWQSLQVQLGNSV